MNEKIEPTASTEPPAAETRTPIGAWIVRSVRWWALLGGVLTLGLALMTATSAVSNLLTGRPFPADYELVKHVIAVAIFMFLPYCQITGSNVSVDIFTERMKPRAKAAMAALSSILAIAFSVMMLVQMYGGLQSYIKYREVTPVLKLPLWTAFPPILLSLVLLTLASFVTLAAQLRSLRAAQNGAHA
ncbi:TRAP transporter small permease [Puniceibacterium sediminis]|uniref:TRAP transporter small permease protein n=1 Tax=Puniceibacterium sediminis TaxID=1608407 RepID=A0A238Y7J2_9RHOB|nr:TRAP transporter small permease [Puniceibacterium sediminis]SNR66564.1 TRAP-type C4-dicarboxylate transport system, small permease component [Puniceibacterium sediminis]